MGGAVDVEIGDGHEMTLARKSGNGDRVVERGGGGPAMPRYKLEIFETYEGTLEPVLRERSDIFAGDDASAVAEANRRYDELAKAVDEAKARVTLAGVVLYDGFRVVTSARDR
jgi:hypothetical protein